MPFSLIPRLPTSPPLSRFPTPMPQQLVEKSPRSASSKGLGKVRMTVPVILGLTSEGTDDRPGHPRTSRMLVRTKQAPHFKL